MFTAFRTGGLDPDKNPRLAAALARAKDAGVPKSNIENAFARVSLRAAVPQLGMALGADGDGQSQRGRQDGR